MPSGSIEKKYHLQALEPEGWPTMARPGAYMDYSLQSRVWNEIFKAGLTPAIPPVSPSVHIWRRPNQS